MKEGETKFEIDSLDYRIKIIINSKVLYKLLNSKKCKKSIYILKIHKRSIIKSEMFIDNF
jgi:hypothetical protein